MEKQTPQAQKRPSVPIFDVISNFSSSSHQRGVCCKPQKLLSIITQKLSFTVSFLTKSFLCDFRILAFQESLRSHPTSTEALKKMASSSSRFGLDGHAHQQPFRAFWPFNRRKTDDLQEDTRNLIRQPITASEDASGAITFFYYYAKGIKEEKNHFSWHSISTLPSSNISSLRRS